MKNRILNLLLVSLAMTAMLASCEYEFIPVPQPPPPVYTDTISFAAGILPIFNTNNNCTSCHNTGGQQPDLTPNHAFSSIMDLGLVDLATPESSILYDFPRPGTSTHTWKKYTQSQSEDILEWIRQGALNN